ncbi:response regulator [Blautia schinkii]|nr:response regulator [Blautia schinkii]
MYRVLVADDEPAARNHIVNIIKKKCSNYDVCAVAEDGRDALEKLGECAADVVITDVKMPIMDGIELSGKIKQLYPQMLVIVVSGYQEFEYAKGALKNGVIDYLLKPVRPMTLKETLDKMTEKLDILYCSQRNEVLGCLCNERELPKQVAMEQLFQEDAYYLALLHINALHHGRGAGKQMELLTMEGEQIYCYGRNERELLLVCPKKLVYGGTFSQVVEAQLARLGNVPGREERFGENGFYTAVYSRQTYSWREFSLKIKELYQTLERNVRIGENQLLLLENTEAGRKQESYFERMEQMVKDSQRSRLRAQIRELFSVWERQRQTQKWVENQLHYLLCLLSKYGLLEGSIEENSMVLDDAVADAFSMKELCESVLAILDAGAEEGLYGAGMDKELLFKKIQKFMLCHLSEELSVQRLCREFAVSQTSLGKLFRTYAGCSFNTCLTKVRVEEAKKILTEEPGIFIRDVAERTGYKDQFYFSRIFRAVTGVCPSDYHG